MDSLKMVEDGSNDPHHSKHVPWSAPPSPLSPPTPLVLDMRVKERRHYSEDCLQDEDIEGRRLFSVHEKLSSPKFGPYFVRELKGEEFSLKYIQEHGFDQPLLFKDKTGLGMRIPNENFTVNDVRQYVGNKRLLDVMDVSTQRDVEMTMKDWARYYENPVRDRLYNVISLEFSHTRMEPHVEAPTVVRQLDWVDLAWPRNLKEGHSEATVEDVKYPKVQKYCLMSVKGCYTDFHIDFGGSSVWYHIFKGQKIFWLIPPTEKNLLLYEKWVLSGKQSDIFFGDTVEQCARISLSVGDTFFIPSGWIHAVYTPVDSMVFGGNFLHSFGADMQIRVAEVEDTTRVRTKFRYPFFTEMMWYVLQRHVHCLLGKNYLVVEPPPPVEEPAAALLPADLSQLSLSAPALATPKPIWKPPRRVHLTKFELRGLQAIVQWLIQLPPTKKCVPDSLTNPEGLLNDIKVLLQEHGRDDPLQAMTGKAVLSWPSSPKSKTPGSTPGGGKSAKDKKNNANSSARRRRTRCKKCQACLRADCGDCHFCKDMKKFGGPGKMKQSCISRQCMAPVLPHTACCMLCGRDGWEKMSNPQEHESSSLMECSQCWEIVHPACLRDRFPHLPREGASNDELPNSWECPKCCRGDGKSDQVKPRNLKINKPPATSQAPAPVTPKEEPLALDHHRPYIGPPTILAPTFFPPTPSQPPLALPKPPERASLMSSVSSSDQPLSLTTTDRSLSSKYPPHQTGPINYSTTASTPPSNHKYPSFMHSPASSKPKKYKPPTDSKPKSNFFTPVSSRKHSETSRDRLFRSLKGLKKSSELGRHHPIYRVNKLPRPSDCSSPLSLTTSNKDLTPKSEESPPPPKMIKIEAPSSPEDRVIRPNSRPGLVVLKEEEKEEKKGDQPPEEMTNNKMPEGANLIKPKYVVRPTPFVDEYDDDTSSEKNSHVLLRKTIAYKIFQYLSPRDLNVCQFVCKAWNRWTIDPKFWTTMNLSRHRITVTTLMGIIRRQPVKLNLAWSNISRRQLFWLINRLPQLRELSLTGCSAAAVSALCTCNCPLLRTLDLSWMEGLTDLLIKDLLLPPADSRPGFVESKTRLRQLVEIRLAGAEVSDVSLRVLTHNLPQLTRLDLSHCTKVTDMGVAVLGATKSSRLAMLDVSYCSHITDTSLEVLRRCPNLTHLDMRHCSQVSPAACLKFAHHTRMQLTEQKLFTK